ncbi:MAG: MMPL family transporter, partial [Planctomycetaceae bacterium]
MTAPYRREFEIPARMHGSSSPRHDAPVPEQRSLLGEGLRAITRLGSRRPLSTLWFVVLSACVAAAFSFLCLDFKTERADLIDPTADFHQRWMKYTRSFGDSSDIIVVVEGGDSDAIRAALEELGTRLSRENKLFKNVLYKVSAGSLRSKGLQFLTPAQLQRGLRQIGEYSPVLRGQWDLIRLESLLPRLQYQLTARTASKQPGAAGSTAQLKPVISHAQLLAASLSSYVENERGFRNPWPTVLPVDTLLGDVGDEAYFLNETRTMGFIKALPASKGGNFSGDSKPIARIRELIADCRASHPDVTIGMTGVPVLEADEMSRSQTDMLLSTAVSILGLAALLFVGFRGFRHPLLGMAMLAIGMAWSFGFTTLAVGHLNILSVSFAVMLIGLGVDFAVVYIQRYLELRHGDKPLRTALLEATDGVGTGIISAAVTTALAFFCATLTDFRGIAELGIIAGGGILLCALAAFATLPALIAIADRDVERKRLPSPFEGKLLSKITSGFPVPTLAVCAVLVVLLGTQMFRVQEGRLTTRVSYDYNLLNLQADGVESVELQKKIVEESGGAR